MQTEVQRHRCPHSQNRADELPQGQPKEDRFFVGANIRDAEPINYTFTLTSDIITETLQSYCRPVNLDKRLKSDGSYEMLECQPVERASFPCPHGQAGRTDAPRDL